MYRKYIGSTSLLLIGLLFGLSGVIAKYLSAWLDPYQVVEYRFFIAFICAVLLALITKQKFSLGKVDPKTLILFAVTFPLSSILFTLAIFNTTVSITIFSFYIANLASSFLVGRLYFGEQITLNKKIALFFIVLAIVAFTNPFEHFQLQLGFSYGILSGIFQTIASSFQKVVGQAANRMSLLITQTLAGTILSVLAIQATGATLLVTMPPITMLIAILFGVIYLLIAYLFLVGFKYVNLQIGSILVSTELFFGPFFAFLLLSENLTKLELLGGLFIAIAVIFANKTSKRRSPIA